MGTPAADLKIKAWTPAVPCKLQDNIVSSKFANAKVFVPSYESTRTRPCMEQLLTNEYQRVWWQEKEAWDKKFARKTVSKTLLQRKVIPRRPPTTESAVKLSLKVSKRKKKVRETKSDSAIPETSAEEDKNIEEMKSNPPGDSKKEEKAVVPEEKWAEVTKEDQMKKETREDSQKEVAAEE